MGIADQQTDAVLKTFPLILAFQGIAIGVYAGTYLGCKHQLSVSVLRVFSYFRVGQYTLIELN